MRNVKVVPYLGGLIALRAGQSFATTEVRWFGEGALPDSLVRWFTTAPASIELRCDQYRVDGSPNIGLKRRGGGSLEVKFRCASSGTAQLNGSRSGRIEGWRKLTDIELSDIPIGSDPVWVDVDKALLTRTYRRSPDGDMQATTPHDTVAAGCDVELASVEVENKVAWTFALEAWGPDTDRSALLHDTLTAFAAETPLPDELVARLHADAAYPQWLATVVEGIGSPAPVATNGRRTRTFRLQPSTVPPIS